MYGFDEKQCMVLKGLMLISYKERENMWNLFLGRNWNHVAEARGEKVVICDMMKGVPSALQNSLTDVHMFYCTKHRIDNVFKKTAGKRDKLILRQLIHETMQSFRLLSTSTIHEKQYV